MFYNMIGADGIEMFDQYAAILKLYEESGLMWVLQIILGPYALLYQIFDPIIYFFTNLL